MATNWSVPLHLLLAPLAVVLASLGYRLGNARCSFGVLMVTNCLAAAPWTIARAFAFLGGSPTAQMSRPSLWSAWFHLWPVLMIGLGLLFLFSLGAAGHHIYRHVVRSPRKTPLLSLPARC